MQLVTNTDGSKDKDEAFTHSRGMPCGDMTDGSSTGIGETADTTTAAALQQQELPIDKGVKTSIETDLVTFAPNDTEGRQKVAEVDSRQEWEIRDIIGKEDVDGVLHYWVKWEPTLVPKYELKKAKRLVEKFEARLRAQGRQKVGKSRGKLLTLREGNNRTMRVSMEGDMQQKKRRGRPPKHV
jgi:hypothetical protein